MQRRLNLGHTLQKISEGLVSECLLPQHTAYDNITAIIVTFNQLGGASEDPDALLHPPAPVVPVVVPGAAPTPAVLPQRNNGQNGAS